MEDFPDGPSMAVAPKVVELEFKSEPEHARTLSPDLGEEIVLGIE